MSVKLVGKQKIDFVKNGERVVGIKLHCVCTTNDEKFEGMRVETFFISSNNAMHEQCVSFPVGSELSVMYNRFGRADSITLCDQKK